jgi:glycosyltransferase involved in cell wall biosynthesis
MASVHRSLEVTGFTWLLPSESRTPLTPAWLEYFAGQTLQEVSRDDEQACGLLSRGLPDAPPHHLTLTVLEEMAWALISRPDCDAVVHPLYVSLNSARPRSVVSPCPREAVDLVLSSGFLALCRPCGASTVRARRADPDALALLNSNDVSLGVFSRALLEETAAALPEVLEPAGVSRQTAKEWVKARVPARQWAWLKERYLRIRTFLEPPVALQPQRPEHDTPLALGKSWEPPFPRPNVRVHVPRFSDRIPVWVALHWLELGGAEKFAVDLIKALPKDRYAVYLTTDVPSENPWVAAIRDDVEEILHFPEFLPGHMIGIFCEHFVRTRNVRLLHLNHSPRVYESLFHVRRFHPTLRVLQTLHIIELADNGGFPEWTLSHFGVFIDHHHVISRQLKDFLEQRWLISSDDISLIRIGVDVRRFDPGSEQRGSVRRWFAIPDDAILIGFVGRLTRQKRPLEFVRMAKLLSDQWRLESREPPLHFILVGDGTLREEVEDAIDEMHFGRVVHLMGETSHTRCVYKDCDLIAMPSENEGLAIVTYEAMAMCTPVFFTDVGGQSELLPREQLVGHAMPVAPALADRLWPYLLDAEARRALGEHQRQQVVRHHSIDENFRSMVGLYDRLLGEVPGVSPVYPRRSDVERCADTAGDTPMESTRNAR